MTDRGHIRDRAAGLAALPPGDPERDAAFAHAASCADCRRALEEGQRLRALLEALPAAPPPSPEALARVSTAILGDLAAPKGARPLPRHRVVYAAVVAAWVLFALLAKRRSHDPAVWGESLVALAVAIGSVVLFPRLRGWALALVFSASSLLVWRAGGSPGLDVLVGIKCTVIELCAAAMPYAALAYETRTQPASVGATRYALVAAAGALAGQAALDLTCTVRNASPHLLVFHCGTVLLAAALGAALSAPLMRRAR